MLKIGAFSLELITENNSSCVTWTCHCFVQLVRVHLTDSEFHCVDNSVAVKGKSLHGGKNKTTVLEYPESRSGGWKVASCAQKKTRWLLR